MEHPARGRSVLLHAWVLLENSLGALGKLQIWFGFGELMRGGFSDAQRAGVQSSPGPSHMAAAGGNEQTGAVGGEVWGYRTWSLLLMPGG